MRKTSAVLATLSLAVLALTGCSVSASSADESCDRSGVKDSVLNVADVSGDLGKAPDVEVNKPVELKKSAFADITVGDGRALSTEFQPFVMGMAFYSGKTGDLAYESEFDGDLSRVATISTWVAQVPGIKPLLECATAGSRILAVLTPEDFGQQNVAGFGLDKNEDVVAVIDILDVHLSRAEGTLQFNDAKGMPTVVRAPDGTPGVIVPDGAAPKEQVSQTLIKGDGKVVKEGDTVFYNLTTVTWNDKKVTSTTWGSEPSNGPAPKELLGATVGSQLLLVVPAADENSSATVLVVDILAAVPASTP